MPRKLLYYRLRTLAVISLAWIIFGAVFFVNLIKPTNDLGVRVSLFQFCFTFGIIGFIVSAVLIFFLKPAFNHLQVWLSILIKLLFAGLLFFVITFILLMVYFYIHYTKDLGHYLNSFFTKLVYTYSFGSFIIDLGMMAFLSILLLEVSEKYGPGMIWRLLVGKYHHPK